MRKALLSIQKGFARESREMSLSANVRATLSMCKFLSRWALRRVEKIAKGSVRRNQNAAHTDMIGKALRKLFRSVSAVAYVSVG